ncbi:MAG: RDD family protein [Chloroflexi bacterium]|nr:RDD family protein [Chloroflexota bacterium]
MRTGIQHDLGVTDGNSLPFRGAAQGTSYVCAPVWRRFVAGLIDWVLALFGGAVGGVFVAIGFIVVATIVHDDTDGANMSLVGAVFLYYPASWVVATLILLLFAYRSSSRGDTPGHRLVQLRIVGTDGGTIGRGRALVRQVLGSPFLVLPYLGFTIGIFSLVVVGYWIDLPRVVGYATSNLPEWTFGALPFILLSIVGLVGPVILAPTNHVWMIFDGENRGWHDVLTGTVVVLDK